MLWAEGSWFPDSIYCAALHLPVVLGHVTSYDSECITETAAQSRLLLYVSSKATGRCQRLHLRTYHRFGTIFAIGPFSISQ